MSRKTWNVVLRNVSEGRADVKVSWTVWGKGGENGLKLVQETKSKDSFPLMLQPVVLTITGGINQFAAAVDGSMRPRATPLQRGRRRASI